jgi:anaerobic magnesium-protoporphyrin IX monomethyl ester cyclase
MQIRVNFVENHNMKIGRYDVPMSYLKNVVSKYPDHAFGHYFLSRCYRETGMAALAEEHLGRFLDICERDHWWSGMAQKYQVHLGRFRARAPSADELVTPALN